MTQETDDAIAWDDCDWQNTHLETTRGMYHLGTHIDGRGVMTIALCTENKGATDEAPGHIILLTDEDIDNLFQMVRMSAKSL